MTGRVKRRQPKLVITAGSTEVIMYVNSSEHAWFMVTQVFIIVSIIISNSPATQVASASAYPSVHCSAGFLSSTEKVIYKLIHSFYAEKR